MEATEVSAHPVLVRGLAQCLKEIFVEGFYADKVLERCFKKNRKWGSRDRRFVAETTYNITRWWSLLLFYFGQNNLASEEDFLKVWALYEAWKNKKDAIGFLQKSFNIKISQNWINECLNRKGQNLWDAVAFPEWLYKKFEKSYKNQTGDLLKSLNDPAPVCLRANTLKINREKLSALLRAEKIETRNSGLSSDGLILSERQNVFITKAFKEGFFEVQDEASQLVGPLLRPVAGQRIADMCAGAGGKTLHLAALMQNKGTLLACDVSERKLLELKTRANRAGVSNLRVEVIEGTKSIKRFFNTFDGVLIDAPCSGSGVIRRNPDSKWKLNPEQLDHLLKLQKEILESYSRLVKNGGRLVYATCSLLPEENEEQIDYFLSINSEFKKEGKALVTRPDQNGCDGFFAQLLIRK